MNFVTDKPSPDSTLNVTQQGFYIPESGGNRSSRVGAGAILTLIRGSMEVQVIQQGTLMT